MGSRRVVNILAAAATGLGLTVTGAVAAAGPPETAELNEVPSTWQSELPAEHDSSLPNDVVSFGRESWVVATIGNRTAQWSAVVQHCVRAGCSAEFLPGPPDTDGPRASGIAGTSPSDLWIVGDWHSAANTLSPLIWRNVTGSWRPFPTTGIVGDASVSDLMVGPDGETWAMVEEDFDGVTWVLYRLEGSTWVQVHSMDQPVFPSPCQGRPDWWYDTIWRDMAIVGGQPTLVGACGEPVILKRRGDAWRRIDKGLPAGATWGNTAVVDRQLWVQGTLADGSVVIYRRASGTWRQVSTVGIPAGVQVNDMAGTVARNVWLVGETGPPPGTPDAAAWRWIGTGWRSVSAGVASAELDRLSAVDAKDYKPAWTVGYDLGLAPSEMGRVLREQ